MLVADRKLVAEAMEGAHARLCALGDAMYRLVRWKDLALHRVGLGHEFLAGFLGELRIRPRGEMVTAVVFPIASSKLVLVHRCLRFVVQVDDERLLLALWTGVLFGRWIEAVFELHR